MKFLISLPLCLSFLLSCTQTVAQVNSADSIFYQSAIYNALAFYQQAGTDQSRLFNGREYKPYRISFTGGHPFFLSDKFSAGAVIYEDGIYDHVQLLYDEVKEMVIAETGVSIELITERIGEFTIAGHRFTRLPADSAATKMAGGFYENLYNGKTGVYKKERKFLGEDLSDTDGIKGVVTTKTYYYLKKSGQYYLVKNKGQVYNVLRDRKNEIQQYIKSNSLDFKHDMDNTLAKIAAYYDQLTK